MSCVVFFVIVFISLLLWMWGARELVVFSG